MSEPILKLPRLKALQRIHGPSCACLPCVNGATPNSDVQEDGFGDGERIADDDNVYDIDEDLLAVAGKDVETSTGTSVAFEEALRKSVGAVKNPAIYGVPVKMMGWDSGQPPEARAPRWEEAQVRIGDQRNEQVKPDESFVGEILAVQNRALKRKDPLRKFSYNGNPLQTYLTDDEAADIALKFYPPDHGFRQLAVAYLAGEKSQTGLGIMHAAAIAAVLVCQSKHLDRGIEREMISAKVDGLRFVTLLNHFAHARNHGVGRPVITMPNVQPFGLVIGTPDRSGHLSDVFVRSAGTENYYYGRIRPSDNNTFKSASYIPPKVVAVLYMLSDASRDESVGSVVRGYGEINRSCAVCGRVVVEKENGCHDDCARRFGFASGRI